MKELDKKFGLGERSIRSYLAISRLSDTLKSFARSHGAEDTHLLEAVSTEEKWTDKDKKSELEKNQSELARIIYGFLKFRKLRSDDLQFLKKLNPEI